MPEQINGADRAVAPAHAPAPHRHHQIVRATAAHLDDAARLLNAYFDAIDVVLRDDRAAILTYLNDPACGLWIAFVDGVAAGCVALRTLAAIDRAAECKRLYIAPPFRRCGLAEALMAALEAFAVSARYATVYLDSKSDLTSAIALYHRLGYTDCARYNDNPQATVFMRKQLG